MNGTAGFFVAQNLGEYGALSGLGASLQAAAYQVEAALSEPRSAIPIVIGIVLLAYFLLRRRA